MSLCSISFLHRDSVHYLSKTECRDWLAMSCSVWIGNCSWFSFNWSFHSFFRRIRASCDVTFVWLYAEISLSGKVSPGLAIALCFLYACWRVGFLSGISEISEQMFLISVWKYCIVTCKFYYFLKQNIRRRKKWRRWLWGRCCEKIFRPKLSKAQPC